MSIGSTISAPSSGRAVLSSARNSSLNPHTRVQSSSTTTQAPPRSSTSTALTNLDRLLVKKPPHPPQQTPASTRQDHEDNHRRSKRRESTDGSSAGGGLFNALNLNTIIPSLRNPATEAMSPQSLTHLQRLLQSPGPSPKSSIALRWRQYHGADNWDGLLDPLNENLRRELVRYGDLVQAAYHAFHSNPTASLSQHRHVLLPDRSYRLTKSLHATASVELPKFIDGVAPWMTQRSSWIGYVAICDDPLEIKRMGRRDIVISLRGTSTCMEWFENIRTGLVPMETHRDEPGGAKVAAGFYSLYKTRGQHVESLSESIVAEVRRLVKLYEGEELSITVTGHSLGAALALFAADEIKTRVERAPPVAVFSFGGPKAGNRAFAERLDEKGVKVLRVVNANDVITRVPGVLPREEVGRRLLKGERWGKLRSHVMEGYVHVGTELKVDSKRSPYLRPDADAACCHDLESYLHLVDGFWGSDCPFRSDAKRSLVRLLDQQRPNLKRLYVNQAEAMGFDRLGSPVMASPSHVGGVLASPTAYN